ncbi:MAG TPA: saccharopine dehydrogenase NADP-binding domain-containing protein [Candidatus Saccharimonadales bacterium]|nr:saccharopine dehydrogenase NADP-binding domain-containing protein [Candidatus Saccharimonadales bacterium]
MGHAVFVLGGGRMGLVAVRDLIRSDKIDSVTVGDFDTARAQDLAHSIGSDKIRTKKVDATRHEDLVNAVRGADVLVNAIWYEHNLDVMKAAIRAGVHYNDLGGLFHMTKKQMDLNAQAQEANVTAVLGGGESPGITNVLVALCAENLDSVEEIRIRVGGREISQTNELLFPFAVSTVFDEYSKNPVMYLNGEFRDLPPLSGEEEVTFPQPVGINRCHYSIHSEIATLPISYEGVRNVDFKLGMSEKIFKAIKPLIDAGFADTSPLDFKGIKISPREYAIAYLSSCVSNEEPVRCVALRTEVSGKKEGRYSTITATLVGEPSEEFRVKNATGLLTGIGASIVAQQLADGTITRRGAFAPEACISPDAFVQELAKRSLKVEVKEEFR